MKSFGAAALVLLLAGNAAANANVAAAAPRRTERLRNRALYRSSGHDPTHSARRGRRGRERETKATESFSFLSLASQQAEPEPVLFGQEPPSVVVVAIQTTSTIDAEEALDAVAADAANGAATGTGLQATVTTTTSYVEEEGLSVPLLAVSQQHGEEEEEEEGGTNVDNVRPVLLEFSFPDVLAAEGSPSLSSSMIQIVPMELPPLIEEQLDLIEEQLDPPAFVDPDGSMIQIVPIAATEEERPVLVDSDTGTITIEPPIIVNVETPVPTAVVNVASSSPSSSSNAPTRSPLEEEEYDPFLGLLAESSSMSMVDATGSTTAPSSGIAESTTAPSPTVAESTATTAPNELPPATSCRFCEVFFRRDRDRHYARRRRLAVVDEDLVIPNSIVPSSNGMTCGTAHEYASSLSPGDCATLRLAESLCCPQYATEQGGATTSMSMSMPLGTEATTSPSSASVAVPPSTPSPVDPAGTGGPTNAPVDSTDAPVDPPTPVPPASNKLPSGAATVGISSFVASIAAIVGLRLL